MSETVNNLKWRALFAGIANSSSSDVGFRSQQQISDDQEKEAMDLIKNGLDYTTVDEAGKTVVGIMRQDLEWVIDAFETEERLLRAMIESGGYNPLVSTHLGDTQNLMKERDGMAELEDMVAGREYQGVPLRDENGGNIYHVMAERSCSTLANGIERLLKQRPEHSPIRTEWMRERLANGQTPLHLLWSMDNIDKQLTTGMVDDLESAIYWCSEATVNMIKLGADLFAEDSEGVTPYALIEQANEKIIKIKPYYENMVKIKSRAQALLLEKQMEHDTPQSALRGKPGPRL